MDEERKWQAPVLSDNGKVQPDTPAPLTITGLVRDAAAGAGAGRGSRLFVTESRADEAMPIAPPGVSVDENMRRAREVQGTIMDGMPHDMPPPDPAYGIMTAWFPKGHEMDYKTGGDQYRPFGNFNYGAVGTALGIGPYMLHGAAGVQQMKEKHWIPDYGYPFISGNSGDNQEDYEQIDKGIGYGKSRRPR